MGNYDREPRCWDYSHNHLTQAYQEGRDAVTSGRTNFYRRNTDEWRRWEDGFTDRKKEIEAENDLEKRLFDLERLREEEELEDYKNTVERHWKR